MEATLSESRKRVVASSRDGKMENSTAFSVYRLIIRIRMARVMLSARQRSRIMGGRGMIISSRMPMIPTDAQISLRVARSFQSIRLSNGRVCVVVVSMPCHISCNQEGVARVPLSE